jgi:hypothetical protein
MPASQVQRNKKFTENSEAAMRSALITKIETGISRLSRIIKVKRPASLNIS